MTISTTSNTVVVQGNGLTTSFSFTFPVPMVSELYVYYTDSLGNSTLLSPNSYSVTGIGSAVGGAVTYPLAGSPIATGTSLTIQRVVPYQQLTDLVNQSGYYPNVVENALDYLTMQTQQLAQSEGLALSVPLSTTPRNLVLPGTSARANQLVGFDTSGNAVTYPITTSVGAGNLTVEGPFVAGVHFTPGTTTTLTLSQAYGSVANVNVHFDGVYQGTDQYSLSGTQIIFSSPIPIGVQKVYVVGGTTLSLSVPPNGTVGDAQLSWGNVLTRVCDSIAALGALNVNTYTRAYVTGYYAPGDGGGGSYAYNASISQSQANGGTIIAAAGGVGCWMLQYVDGVGIKQFGSRFDGVTNDTTTNQAAFNALPTIGKLRLPVGTSVTGLITPPVVSGSGNGYIVEGAGVGQTIFRESSAGAGIFGAPLGIIFGAEFRGFSCQCHASANGGGTGILLSGYYNTKFSKVGYLSNGTGYWANLFLVAASPELSYGNTIEEVHILGQVGPGIPISFGNGGLGINYNANACRIVGGIIASNTKVGTCIDATRSINTVISRIWLENNFTTATITGNQADAAAGVNSGQGTVISGTYMEKHNPYVQYPSVTDGPSNNGLCIGNTFSPSWQTTTTFFNGASGNLWVGNNEGGLPVILSGAAGVNWKIGATLSLAQALALIPTIAYSSGTNGSLVVSSTAVVNLAANGDITFRWNLTWTPLASGTNTASIFSIAAVTGYALKSLSVSSNIPVLNSIPMACSPDISGSTFVVNVTQPGSPNDTQNVFVQATYARTI